MALLRASAFSERLNTTSAHVSVHERDGYAKPDLGQVTSWPLEIR